MRNDIYSILTPVGHLNAVFPHDEDLPVQYDGSAPVVSWFKAYLEDAFITGAESGLVTPENLTPYDLYNFCQPDGSGVIVTPPFDHLLDYVEQQREDEEQPDVALDDAIVETLPLFKGKRLKQKNQLDKKMRENSDNQSVSRFASAVTTAIAEPSGAVAMDSMTIDQYANQVVSEIKELKPHKTTTADQKQYEANLIKFLSERFGIKTNEAKQVIRDVVEKASRGSRSPVMMPLQSHAMAIVRHFYNNGELKAAFEKADIAMDSISFAEKRVLQKTVQEQSQILAGSPTFAVKRTAQKTKQEAMDKLGLVSKSYEQKLEDLKDRSGITDKKIDEELANQDLPGTAEQLNKEPAVIPPLPDNSESELNKEPVTTDTEFGLQSSGVKTREKINAKVADLVAQIKAGKDVRTLTAEEIDLFKQYSGRGGLTENSQYEYYTPTHVAAGCWDLLKENGFQNGNVLEPSAGAGVFSATKSAGVKITGAEIDAVSATVNQVLHPDDTILNQSFEKLAVSVPDNHYDAVIGNVPFGDARGEHAHDDPQYKGEKRIERYFISRTIDKTRPGGLIVLVGPTSVVSNPEGPAAKFRAAISRKAEFLGAHKLPSKTFAKQGTNIVTDIIVLRKHSAELLEKIDKLPVKTLKNANVLWDEFISGKYFQGEGKRFIKGQYVPPNPDHFRPMEQVIAEEGMTNEHLKQALAVKFDSRIDWAALDAAAPVINYYAEGDHRIINGKDHVFEGGRWVEVTYQVQGTIIDKEKFGVESLEKLTDVLSQPESMLGINVNHAFAAYKKYPNLFNEQQRAAVVYAMSQPLEENMDLAYRFSLIGSMVSNYVGKINAGIAVDSLERDKIVNLLERTHSRYGSPKNLKGFLLEGEQARFLGAYLGAFDASGKVASLIRLGSQEATGFNSTDVASITEHLTKKSGSGFELSDLQAIYTGGKDIKSLGDIADIDGICITPQGMITTPSAYLNGEIYAKVADMQSVIANENDSRLVAKYQKQIDAMLAKAKITPIDEISFGLRDKWVDRRYQIEFLAANGYAMDYVVTKQEMREGLGKEYLANVNDYEDTTNPDGEWQAGRYGKKQDKFAKQLVKYMNGKSITYQLPADDEALFNELRAQANELEEQFKQFMQTHADFTDLEAQYNRTFNGYVKPDYDSGPLNLKGIPATVQPKWYQNQGVRWLSDQGAGILGYDVGLGKTFSAIAFSEYDRQNEKSKKHCIVVPNSVLANWYNESKKFLGNHNNVMLVGFYPDTDKSGNIIETPVLDENGKPIINQYTNVPEMQDKLVLESKDEWMQKMFSIPTADVGLVIMTYEKFKLIPMRPENVAAYAEKWVNKNLISKAQQKEMTKGDKTGKSYNDDKEEANIRQKYSDSGTKKADELPYFEDMGFDRVIVDEAHYFKNSYGVGSDSQRLAYLSNAVSSQRARDMAMKMSYLRDRYNGKGPIMLTATPVANSPIEIYNMLTLVIDPAEFERYGIYTPDDFIKMFGIIDQVDKMKVSGLIANVEGLAGFKNLNALRQLFHRYANMKNAKDVDPNGDVLRLPDSTEFMSYANMSATQQSLYAKLRKEALLSANPANIKAGQARPMFAVIRDMDRVTTDPDMYYQTITYHFKRSDKDKLAALIADLPNTIDVKGGAEEGEMEDSDKITIKKEYDYQEDGDTIIYAAPEAYGDLVDMRLTKFKIDYANHPLQPKYAKMIQNLTDELGRGGKQLVFTEEKSQHNKILRIIANNVPILPSQIAVINADTAKGEALQQIADAYNRGDHKIIIANKKAEVGVNLQKGTTAIHHMTLPWNPASIQQRNGRGVRQGNKATMVTVYYYQANGSFDEYRLDLLKNKGNWIDALMDKEANNDTAENAAAMGAFEQAALLSENKDEFLAKMAEMKAKKEREEKERRDKSAKVKLIQLIAKATILQNMETDKKKAMDEIQDEINSAERRLAIVQQNQGATEEDITAAKNRVSALKARLSRQDAVWEKKRQEAEIIVRQNQGFLRGQSEKGLIPFSRDVIDNPANAYVHKTGKILKVDGWYKYSGSIVKITQIDRFNGTCNIEFVLTGQAGNSYSLERLADSSDFVEIAPMQPDELEEAKLLQNSFTFGQLKTLSKASFEKYRGRIKLDGTFIICNDGQYSIGSFNRYNGNPDTKYVVYPDAEDQSLMMWLKQAYKDLTFNRNREQYGFSSVTLAPRIADILGDDWQSVMQADMKRASAAEITKAVAKAIDDQVQLMAPESSTDTYSIRTTIQALQYGYGSTLSTIKTNLHKWFIDNEYVNAGDGLQDLTAATSAKIEQLTARIADIEKAAAQEKINAARNDPNFKQVPDEIARKLPGIRIWYNTEQVVTEFKGRKTTYQPFSRLFIKDSNGKNGAVFMVKDILKSRHDAMFCGSVYSGGREYADTWHVPASVDLEKIVDLIG